MNNSAWNMYVFRDGRKSVPGHKLVSALVTALREFKSAESSHSRTELAVNALVAAGELECALADSDSSCAKLAEDVSDRVADVLVGATRSLPTQILDSVEALRVNGEFRIAVHEGFAYYALHPLKFARLVEQVTHSPRVAVVGLRSIGAPLSAVVSAALRKRGSQASRITVRPTGHPYDRRLSLSEQLRVFVAANRGAKFLIADEGPGLSGSSFLSVAEALEESGVPPSDIILLGSREPDVSQLRAPRAPERWPRFRFLCAESAPIMPDGAAIPIAGGEWRNYFAPEGELPACWPQLEMSKFLSPDRRDIYKFEGFGHFGAEIADRSRFLAEHKIGAPHLSSERGFGRYQMLPGRLLQHRDLSAEVLQSAAKYCALRASAFPADGVDMNSVSDMMHWNLQCEFGCEVPPAQRQLPVERPAIVDGRMLPHEWMLTHDGRLLKLDAVSHGDDHFLPGPCDIAWDLAGFIIEWRLDSDASELLVSSYRQFTGDCVERRLRPYLLAYTAFRLGWSRMAAQACAGQPDELLLKRDCLRYRYQAETLLAEQRINLPMQGVADQTSKPAAA